MSEYSKNSISSNGKDSSGESYSQSSFIKLLQNRNNISQGSIASNNALFDVQSQAGSFNSQDWEVKQTKQLQVSSVLTSSFLNQYMIIDTVGNGQHGKVKLCFNFDTQELNAIKFINKQSQKYRLQLLRKKVGNSNSNSDSSDISLHQQQEAEETWQREIKAMTKLQQHPNVVQLLEVIDDPQNSQVLLVMQYIDGGPIFNLDDIGNPKNRCHEDLARTYFKGVIQGLKYLHENGVVHGDIKPSNLFLSNDGRVCIGDFGSARLVKEGEKLQESNNGTPAFLAPERCLSNKAYDGFKSDIWAAGITLYLMAFNSLPKLTEYFTNQDTEHTLKQVWVYDQYYQDNYGDKEADGKKKNEQYQQCIDTLQKRDDILDFPEDADVSFELKDLLRLILRIKPDNRLTLDEIMQHPWVQNTTIGKGSSKKGSKRDSILSSWPSELSFSSISSLSNRGSQRQRVRDSQRMKSKQVDELLKTLKFKTKKFKKGEQIFCSKKEFTGLIYLEKGLVHKRIYFEEDNMFSLHPVDDDFWQDFESMEIMSELMDSKVGLDMNNIGDKFQHAINGVLQKQVMSRPEAMRELQKRFSKMPPNLPYDVLIGFGQCKVPEGYMYGYLEQYKKCRYKHFTLTAQSDVTVQLISQEQINLHKQEQPELEACINGTLNYCRSELLRRIFTSKVYKQKHYLDTAFKVMSGKVDGESQTTADDFKESKRNWSDQNLNKPLNNMAKFRLQQRGGSVSVN